MIVAVVVVVVGSLIAVGALSLRQLRARSTATRHSPVKTSTVGVITVAVLG
ncbi:MAG: hypothetical protein M3Y36_00225 [Actinomycetota bacterium]|nr:hypothetical protein [Actinomycetota bacterium]